MILKISNLTKKYKDFIAVDNLNLQVDRGEIFGLLGHNGAGKSTTIECVLGIKKIDNGQVSLLGMNPVKDRKKLFQSVGVQLQESNFLNKIKVKEVCEMTSSFYERPFEYKELLKEFSLSNKIDNFVADLSGGERQKLSVLLALLPNPKIIFLDELTTGLDPKARREIWSKLKALKDKGVSIFLTSHYMDEVEYLCDRIMIMKRGKEVICDSPQNVIKKSGKASLEEAYLLYIGEEEMEYEVI
ncbi:ABC transporter ATP-binding protein [Clostridium paraputrificum]|uniref:ABC transporter ATP-binding protein n=1 Tax=Clostridium TaxID=1485 RepID=UPI003D359073